MNAFESVLTTYSHLTAHQHFYSWVLFYLFVERLQLTTATKPSIDSLLSKVVNLRTMQIRQYKQN